MGDVAWGATEKAWKGTKLLSKGLWKTGPLNLIFFGPEAFAKASKSWKAFGPSASKTTKLIKPKGW